MLWGEGELGGGLRDGYNQDTLYAFMTFSKDKLKINFLKLKQQLIRITTKPLPQTPKIE